MSNVEVEEVLYIELVTIFIIAVNLVSVVLSATFIPSIPVTIYRVC